MPFAVYLDEFGHDGPFVKRDHPKFNESPVFGLGGYALPLENVRAFSVWFFQLKQRLLAWEIQQSGLHPAKWEKKGSSLFTTKNITKYPELRQATNRIINKIRSEGGFLFYHGIEKYDSYKGHDSKAMYRVTLSHAIKRLDEHFDRRGQRFFIFMDQHDGRERHVEAAARTMFGEDAARRLIEPPLQVESHLYQTLQCADWLCGLIGRLACYGLVQSAYSDFEWAERYFGRRIDGVSQCSSIKRKPAPRALAGDTAMGAAFKRALESAD